MGPPTCALEMAIEENSQDKVLYKSPEWVRQDWWTLFDDDQLTCFIEGALQRNPTLQEARAKVVLARANADRANASLLPNIDWGADVARQKLSRTGVIPFNNINVPVSPDTGPFRIPEYFTQYETQFTLRYEFDLWGKNRNALRAALGEMEARIADSAFADLILSHQIARVYFQLQTEYKRRSIARQIVENRCRYYTLVAKRVASRIDTALSRNSAENELTMARKALLAIEGSIAIHENELKAYLAGDFQETICDSFVIEAPLPMIPLPCDLPMHLLSRRPDIASQLWLIESASRSIAVAKASFYPDFSITALFGFQTIHFQELFKWPSSYFNVDPAVTLPIFDAGRRYANLRGSEVNYDIAVYEYNNLVLNAVKEVLTGIAVLRNSEAQWDEYSKSAELEEKNFQLVSFRVANKIDTELSKLNSEQKFLQAQDYEVISKGQTLDAILALIKAMGGGYGESPCDNPGGNL